MVHPSVTASTHQEFKQHMSSIFCYLLPTPKDNFDKFCGDIKDIPLHTPAVMLNKCVYGCYSDSNVQSLIFVMISRNPIEQFGYASLQSSPFLPRSSAILKSGDNFSSKDEDGLKLIKAS
jgi:hypothetical protein